MSKVNTVIRPCYWISIQVGNVDRLLLKKELLRPPFHPFVSPAIHLFTCWRMFCSVSFKVCELYITGSVNGTFWCNTIGQQRGKFRQRLVWVTENAQTDIFYTPQLLRAVGKLELVLAGPRLRTGHPLDMAQYIADFCFLTMGGNP